MGVAREESPGPPNRRMTVTGVPPPGNFPEMT
jgi:hypothetical protein